jgi:cytochrome c553
MAAHRSTVASIAALCAAAGLAGPVSAPAADAAVAGDAGRGARIGQTCYGCHGIADYRNAYPLYHVPKLGGQHEAYLYAALTEYRSGARVHPTMTGQAASLADRDLHDLAAHFASGAAVVSAGQAPGTLPAAAQVCAACHGRDGVAILPEYPTLAGQHRDYIEQALRGYRALTRKHAVMNGFAATLKDEDIRALADYYSRQSPSLSVPRAPGAR